MFSTIGDEFNGNGVDNKSHDAGDNIDAGFSQQVGDIK